MTTEFKPGDRVRIRDSAPVRLAAQSDRMGIVLAWHDHGMADVWVHSQCCDFDLDFTELQLVSRPVYPKPGEVVVALNVEYLSLLDSGKWLKLGEHISDMVDRVREAGR